MKLLSFGIINLTIMGRSRTKMKNNTNYLTISELGRLRNVDSKSLRYYERVGALIPADANQVCVLEERDYRCYQ